MSFPRTSLTGTLTVGTLDVNTLGEYDFFRFCAAKYSNLDTLVMMLEGTSSPRVFTVLPFSSTLD